MDGKIANQSAKVYFVAANPMRPGEQPESISAAKNGSCIRLLCLANSMSDPSGFSGKRLRGPCVVFVRSAYVPARRIPLNGRRQRHTVRSPGRKTQKHCAALRHTIQTYPYTTARVHQRLPTTQLTTFPVVRQHLAHKWMILRL